MSLLWTMANSKLFRNRIALEQNSKAMSHTLVKALLGHVPKHVGP